MATFNAYMQFDYRKFIFMSDSDGFTSEYILTPSKIEWRDSFNYIVFNSTLANFSETNDGWFGTLNSMSLDIDDDRIWNFTGANYSLSAQIYDIGYQVDGFTFYGDLAELAYVFRESDIIYGSTFSDRLAGFAGNDTLYGYAGNDRLEGWSGDDFLNGGAGKDVMNGGEGSDIYLMALSTEHPGAEINDTGLSGTDEVRYSATSGTLTLYAGDLGLETVVLGTGTASVAVTTATSAVSVNASAVVNGLTITGNNGINTLTGTGFADTIIGNSGNDILVGGLGNDVLRGGLGKDTMTGGAGLDTFRFETAPSASTNLDTIVDFSLADDTIELENAIFTALTATGALNATSFRSGAGIITAADANDYLIYNTTTGFLYYDANGSATGAAIQIATFTGKPLLTASDFLII